MRHILSLLFCTVALAIQSDGEVPSAEKAAEAAGASLLVSFQRSTIRENDEVPVEIWIRNASNFDLSNVTLRIAAPDFLRWHLGLATAPELAGPTLVSQETIPTHSDLNRKFVITTSGDIVDGDYALLFTLEANSSVAGKDQAEFASAEKSIQVHLLGTESIGGIPLALAALSRAGSFLLVCIEFFQNTRTLRASAGRQTLL